MLVNSHISSIGLVGITIHGVYNVMTANPYEIAFSVLAIKLGFTNKILIGIILAFIL